MSTYSTILHEKNDRFTTENETTKTLLENSIIFN